MRKYELNSSPAFVKRAGLDLLCIRIVAVRILLDESILFIFMNNIWRHYEMR